jgi:hypothetical protein
MDVQLLAGIERICSLPEHQLEVELGKLLEGRAPMATITSRAARDSFTKLLARARDGSVQLVGKDKGEQTVILSVAALANVIKAAAGGISAGEFLAATQFQPSRGKLVHVESDDDSSQEFTVRSGEASWQQASA